MFLVTLTGAASEAMGTEVQTGGVRKWWQVRKAMGGGC